jgi:hypothetical protein
MAAFHPERRRRAFAEREDESRHEDAAPMIQARQSILLTVLFCLAAAPAPGASPTIESVAPGIGPRDAAFTVVITRARLKDAKELLFYEPGLACSKQKTGSDNELKATLAASPDCRIGAHAFRVRTPGGLTELKVVTISPFPVQLGDFPRPTGVFPPGGQAGKETRFSLLRPAGIEGVETSAIPSAAGPWWSYFPTLDRTKAPTPTSLRVRPYAGFDESDLREIAPPNPAELTPREWLAAFHGVIAGETDVDAFAIQARSGEMIQVEVFAERLGSPLDSILEVYDPSGDLVGRSDDDDCHVSRPVFRADVDGAYRLQISDKLHEGGPSFLYRIEVEQTRPSLNLFTLGPVRKAQARQ